MDDSGGDPSIPVGLGELYLGCTDDAVLYVDGETILYCNARAYRLFLIDSENLDLVPTTSLFTFDVLRKSEEGCTQIEGKCRRTDGVVFPATIRIARGEENRLLLAVRDQTERAATEESLRRRSAQLTATIESLPFDFWINDRENRTLLQNPYSRELWGDKIGSTLEEITDDKEILASWRKTNERAFSGEIQRDEITYEIDGEDRTFRSTVAPVWDGDEIIGIVGLNVDITDYQQAVADRELLLRELHHRVKNNLQVILSTIAIGRGSNRFDADQMLSRIENHVHAIYLVHEQLDIGNELSMIDLGEYVRNLGTGIDEMLSFQSRIHVTSEAARAPIEEAVPIGIALCELLSNAARYGAGTAPSGIVPIELSLSVLSTGGKALRFSVNNDIEPEPEPSPPGIGILIVQSLVEQLRGTYHAVSEGNRYSATIEIPH